MERAIKKRVQLVKIDNGCCLFSRQSFRDSLDTIFSLSELTKDPQKNIYITDELQTLSFIGYRRKQIIPYVQRISLAYIEKNGQTDFKGFKFPKKLYVDFINLEKKTDLKDFFQKSLGFCIFPTESEMEQLFKKYKKAGLRGAPIYYASYGYKISERLDQQFKEAFFKIAKINIDFIWEKQQELKSFVTDHLSGKKTEDNLLWLNKQLENVSMALMDHNSYLWERVRDAKLIEKDERKLEDIMTKKTNEIYPFEVYRIYGHYALCCLEIALDVQKSLPFYACTECGQLNFKKNGSKRKTCPPENKFCRNQRERKRKEISNKWKKLKKTKNTKA